MSFLLFSRKYFKKNAPGEIRRKSQQNLWTFLQLVFKAPA